jgi:hypothetical protein
VTHDWFIVTNGGRKMLCPVISQVVRSPPSGKGRGDRSCGVGKCKSCVDGGWPGW